MGFMTNQWLKGTAERYRGYYPVEISMQADEIDPSDDWTKRNEVSAKIVVRQPDGDYQEIFFTKEDLNELLTDLARAAGLRARKGIAFDTLLGLDDADLLKFLAELFSGRVTEKNTAE